jgi:hypothetical protein
MNRTYTTGRLARMSQISAGRLKRWDSEGLFRAGSRHQRGSVSDREYTFEQALGIMALGELRRGGVGDRDLRRAAALMPGSITGSKYLVFVGRMICARSEPAEVFELLDGRSGRVIVVDTLVRSFETASKAS